MGRPGDALASPDVTHHGTFTMTGYSLPAGLSYEEWAKEGVWLVAYVHASGWWLGDWLRYGEHNYGDKYTQAVETTGLGISTLKNAQWVADRIPPSERNENVPFSHHKAVASLDPKPRKALLKAAEKESLPEGVLRRRVSEYKSTGELNTGPEPLRVDREKTQARPLAEVITVVIAELREAQEWEDWKMVGRARGMLEEAIDLQTVDA